MKLNFLVVFLTLLTSYSCDKSITYVNYGDDIDIELSYSENIEIEGAKYVPIVYDNGFDLIIAKADDDFPEESIEPTLEQLSENLRKGSRSGANVKIKIRKLEKISDGVSKPVVIGEVQKSVKMN